MNKLKTNHVANLTDFEKPEQMLGLIQNENIRDLIAVITTGRGIVEPGERPEWAVRAAQEFWRSAVDFPRTKRAKSEAYRLGFQWGFVGRLRPKSMGNEHAVLAFLDSGQLDQLFHSEMQKAPAAEAADFYAGLSDGLKRGPGLSPSSPCVIYLLLAVAWREIGKFTNTPAIQQWLQGIIGPNLTGHRDRIAKLLQKIQFPLTDKGGRPKTKPRKLPAS